MGLNNGQTYEWGDVVFQSGAMLHRVRIACKTQGQRDHGGSNPALAPTFYGGRHADHDGIIGPDHAPDSAREPNGMMYVPWGRPCDERGRVFHA